MAGLRWILCLTLALATLPLLGQEEKSAAPPHAIPYGTTLLIRLEDRLDVSRIQPGKRFKAKLAEDLMGPDETMVRRGSKIRGHVSEVGNGFHPRLLLSFDEIETQRGWAPLMATIIDVPGEHGLTQGPRAQSNGEDKAGASIAIRIPTASAPKPGPPRVWCKPYSATTGCNCKKAPCSK